MICAVRVNGEVIDGPGRVGKALIGQNLVGKLIEKDIPLLGDATPSGYMPGAAEFSEGKYRMQ